MVGRRKAMVAVDREGYQIVDCGRGLAGVGGGKLPCKKEAGDELISLQR